MLYCAMFAYGMKRTLILESRSWRYNSDGWDAVFLPVSETCTQAQGTRENWRGTDRYRSNKMNDLEIEILVISVKFLYQHYCATIITTEISKQAGGELKFSRSPNLLYIHRVTRKKCHL